MHRNKQINQIFCYTRYITPKRVTVGGAHIRIAPASNTARFEKKQKTSQRWQAFGDTVPDLTGPRLEPQTSRFRGERVIARLEIG